jgi:hypothetical protein
VERSGNDNAKEGRHVRSFVAFSIQSCRSRYAPLYLLIVDLSLQGMFKEVMNDLWLARISSLPNEVGLYVGLLEVLLFMPNSLIRHQTGLEQLGL